MTTKPRTPPPTATAIAADVLVLRRDETLRLPRGLELLVRVEHGTVLVTQEGDPDDHVLEAGDALVLPAGGLAVAWALDDARLSFAGFEGRLTA
ncbi:MAG TPA: DUF2917 domain-containing protein [Anaeromyxobacteraceae bacterium]